MKISEFVEGYKNSNNADAFIDSHVFKDKYISYAEKINRCANFVLNTSYIKDDEKGMKIYKQNKAARFVIYSLTLIDLYTDIEVEFDNGKMILSFDELDKYGLIDVILNSIPVNERERWDFTLALEEEDLRENERSILGFVENNLNMLGTLAPILDKLEKE